MKQKVETKSYLLTKRDLLLIVRALGQLACKTKSEKYAAEIVELMRDLDSERKHYYFRDKKGGYFF